MNNRVSHLFARKKIALSDLQYLYHADRKTFLCMLDGRKVSTSIPLKEIAAQLPAEDFWSIQKGVVVSARHVLTIHDNVYTMMDGNRFQGRGRNPAEHKRRRQELETGLKRRESHISLSLLEKCTLMENAPIAFCIIELVFADDGVGVDFIFRYCNRKMEEIEGVPVSEMIDRSFYSVFPNGDRKWIIPYADVALNGTQRILRDFSPEVNKHLIIRCFQPEPNYCACFLVEAEGGE